MIDLTGRMDVPIAEDVLRELAALLQDLGVEFFVVGAAARDLMIHAQQKSQPVRATLDIDIAVAVRVGEEFTRLSDRVAKKGRSEHKFEVLDVEVDVIPFGGIEQGRVVRFRDGHLLDLNGLQEAHQIAIPVRLPGGTDVPVASAPAQSALKILAWRDRHLENPKDGIDLSVILTALSEDPFVDDVWPDASPPPTIERYSPLPASAADRL